MGFINIWLTTLVVIVSFMTLLWIVSLILKDAGIVDIFWGAGFVLAGWVYFFLTGDASIKKIIVVSLVTLWGLRLSIHILVRNWGKGEDFRYQQFRSDYGEHRYWWVSFFQVFMLQGVLMWLISAPLLAAQIKGESLTVSPVNYLALALFLFGFIFEAGGDAQLALFKRDPGNKGKILQSGFWKYTRHPNYFGDSMVWWSFGLFGLASGYMLPLLSSLLMMFLLLRVSGVALLEKTLVVTKPGYKEYIESTGAFFPAFWKKRK